MSEDLRSYLAPRSRVPMIGEERGPSLAPKQGIVRLVSPHGSNRYLAFVNSNPVSVLQVVETAPGEAVVANVYTLPSFRRMGYASRLFQRAKKNFRVIRHSSHINQMGQSWAKRQR